MSERSLEPPRSLASLELLAPVLASIAAAITLVQYALLAWREMGLVFLFLAAPALTIIGMVQSIANARRRTWAVAAIGAALHFVLILAALSYESRGTPGLEWLVIALVLTVIEFGVFLAACTPLLIAATHYAQRRDLARGDGFLTAFGLWFFALTAIEALVGHELPRVWVPGFVFAAGAVTFGIVRGVVRRRWHRRLERGEIRGLRLRAWRKHDLDLELPAVDDAPHGELAVVERIDVGSLPYRSAVVGIPIAYVRAADPPEVTP